MQRWKRAFKSALSAATLVMMHGCGGGIDAPFIPSLSDSYNVGRIFFLLLTGSGSWTVSGTGSDGAIYDITILFEPDRDAFFPLTGLPGARSNQTVTVRRNGVVLVTTESTFYDRNTLAIQGTSRSDGTCSQVSSSAIPPADATPGAGGALDTSTDYTACTITSPVAGSTSRTWSIETENILTVFFCSNETNRDLGSQVIATESICLQMTRDGELGEKARVTRTGPGNFSLTARN